MPINDPLGDMLTRIRNAQERKRPKVLTPASNLRARVLDVLKDEGYIRGYARVENRSALPEFEIELKYSTHLLLREPKRISKPSRRIYSLAKQFPQTLPTELLELLNGMEPAELTKLTEDLKFRGKVKLARQHLAKLGNAFVEDNYDRCVTVDVDTGDFVLAPKLSDAVAAFEEKFGKGRRRLTGVLGEMA
jgi:small subunit ribosomal protein S8